MKKKGVLLVVLVVILVGTGVIVDKWRTKSFKEYGVRFKTPLLWSIKVASEEINFEEMQYDLNNSDIEDESGSSNWCGVYKTEDEDLCMLLALDEENEGKANEYLVGFKKKIFIGEQEGYKYYVAHNNAKGVESFINSVKLSEIESLEKTLSEANGIQFTTMDLQGNKVDESIFSDYDITMINVWTTYCAPCKKEMPYLEEIYKEKNVGNINLIGIVADATDKSNINLAMEIEKKKGTTYTNLRPSKELAKQILDDISAVPTTIFVDKEGRMVGEIISGPVSKEEYEKAMKAILDAMKDN